MTEYSATFKKLIDELKRLPGIGPKSAQRIAFHILGTSAGDVKQLADAMVEARAKLKHCSICYNLTDQDPCSICADTSRDPSLLCVVEEPKDLIAIERTHEFKGRYHVLGGVISPLNGMGPENLRIRELLDRVKSGIGEIVLALNPTTEGEATALYLMRILSPLGVKITRIAYGLPIGSDLDYADEATLMKAFEGRREVHV
ncbi:MAG TPA: recombination mediator RecR [Candidatus Omnitrophota bacterium]|nr:recombination mediator RecR [Candidatus Omnitrophota bacterium]